MSISLAGKRILVTGAGGGIGRATARLVAERGAALLITDVNAEGLKETLQLLEQDNPNVEAIAEVLDSTDEVAAAELVERTARNRALLSTLFSTSPASSSASRSSTSASRNWSACSTSMSAAPS
ncbi:SDR family NAD(P)-dependent oxidoreductase [Streptomyces sp. NPDC050625]|uniref:SDR family NAD(P)-dependent oxidoreductase n=1 Tax=Streptomyces sp. NPDC050625 TaxID=3154629 RepID=UPI00343B22F8